MSFLSGLVSDVKNLFGGNTNAPQKKKQAQAPTVITPTRQNQPLPLLPTNNPNNAMVPPPSNNINLNSLSASSLQKVQPTAPNADTQSTAPPAPAQHASILHNITHNAVTDFAGGIVKPTFEMGHALEQVPRAIYREAQNKPINDIQQDVYGTTDSGKLAKKMFGDTVNTALLVGSPGIDAAAEAGVKAASGEAAAQLSKTAALRTAGLSAQDAARLAAEHTASTALTKIAPKVISGSAIGGIGNASSTFENGGSASDVLKSGFEGVGLGGLTGGVLGGIPLLNKLVRDRSSTEVAAGVSPTHVPAPAEVPVAPAPEPVAAPVAAPAPVEPTVPQVSAEHPDAAKIVAQNAPTPAPVAKVKPKEVPNYLSPHKNGRASVPGNNAVGYSTGDPNLDTIVNDSIIAHKGSAATAGTRGDALDAVGITHDQRAEIRNIATANVDKATGKISSAGVKKINGVLTRPDSVAPSGPVDVPVGHQAPPVEAPPTVPSETTPPPKGARTAENAPLARQAAATNLKKLGATIDKTGDSHAVFSNPEITKAGEDAVGTLSDQEVLDRYHGVPNFHGASDVAEGLAAMKRLAPLSAKGDETARQAIDNIMEASAKEISGGGSTVNYTKEFYENLPAPAKSVYVIRQMDKVRDAQGLPLFRDNADLASEVKKSLDEFLTKDENFKEALAKAQDEAVSAKNSLQTGEVKGSPELTQRGVALQKTVSTIERDRQANTAEMAKFYNKQAPPKVGIDEKVGSLGRSLMLSSPTGRANDVVTTAINGAHNLLTDSGAATLGKVANTVTGKPGKYASTFPSLKAVGRGAIEGLKDSRARFQNKLGPSDANQLIKSTAGSNGKSGLASNLGGVVGKIVRPVKAATEIATDLSRGFKQAKIQQMATDTGKKFGLTGDDLKSYTAMHTAAPSREFVEAGNKVQATVNNMQSNPITDRMQRLSDVAVDKTSKTDNALIKTAGQLLKNLTIPFSRWTGGQLWNDLVDNNAAVNAGKMLNAFRKGNRQEAINQASRLGVNGVASASVGYALAKAGILVGKDANGYNDDGVYLKIDGHYIPVGYLGFFAPGLILGKSTHDVLSDPTKYSNPAVAIAKITGDTLVNSLKSGGAASLTGEKNQVLQAIQHKESGPDVAATVGATVAGQYIPAADRDINALLDNGVGAFGYTIPGTDGLNKTHEAALTKVIDPNSKSGKAKDVEGTLKNQLLNKIPVASQKLLPRKTGVAAPDLIDRTTRGSHDTGTSIQNRADAVTTAATQKTLEQRIADNTKAGIPDPQADTSADKKLHYATDDSFDNAVENRIENKKYDQAIGGLQLKLDDLKKSPDANAKQIDPIQKQLSVAKVLKAGNYDPSVRDQYSKVSLDEWRNLGDPESDTYDPAKYQLLYNYDKDLAGAKASDNTNDPSQPKYSAKRDTGKGSGSKAATRAMDLIKSNTISSLNSLPNFSSGSLKPEKITDANAKMPTIQQIPSSTLIKKRSISVSNTR